LVRHRVADLLADRSATTVAAWLAQHPSITVACRDRSELDADGIRRGAPAALQVVDRFHLVHNLRQALEAFLIDHRAVLQTAARFVPNERAGTRRLTHRHRPTILASWSCDRARQGFSATQAIPGRRGDRVLTT
jgi:transposase